MAFFKGKAWGEVGESKTLKEAKKDMNELIEAHRIDKIRFPHHVSSNTKYYYDVMKKGSKYVTLYRW